MNKNLFEVLVCPLCKGQLDYNSEEQELICRFDKLAYPIKDGIPVMLEEQARQVSSKELD